MNQLPEFYNNEWDLWFLPFRGGQTLFAGDEVVHPDLLGKAPASLSDAVSFSRFSISSPRLIQVFGWSQERVARAKRDEERATRLRRGGTIASTIQRPPPASPPPAYAPRAADPPSAGATSSRRRTPLFLSSPSSTPTAPMETATQGPEPEIEELPPASEPTPRTQVLGDRVSFSRSCFYF